VINALGEPQSLLLVGGTSDIGNAILDALATPRLERVVLTGRDPEALPATRGGLATERILVDVEAPQEAASALDAVFDAGDIDVAILAVGLLGDQAADEHDADRMARVLRVNGVDAAHAALTIFRRMARQGHGTLVVLSSIAAVRPRRSNFIYGAGKATIDAVAQGLIEVGRECGVDVILVRPGFVRTRMTVGLPEAPFTVDASDVADDVVEALRKKRSIVYSPAAVGAVAGVLKVLPRPLLRKLPR
jgi:decaprenylphospho-beta-D-erythro-pentofuranosid-2-ulose 2-reductase